MASHVCFGHVINACLFYMYVQNVDMASGLVRSALSGIHERPECQVKTKRVASVVKDADDLLRVISEPSNLDHFDTFSRNLVVKLESCFQGHDTLNRERVWKAFHNLRTHELPRFWEKLLSEIHFRTSVDPLVPQTACQILFEDMIKSKFQEQRTKTRGGLDSSRVLTKDEQNIVRYASGYVAVSLLRRYKQQHGQKAASFVECLSHMAVDGPGDSFMDYTREWITKVNRGGLFETSDNAYMLFASIELASYGKLEDRLVCQPSTSTCTDKRSIVDAVLGDTDVRFYWSMLSVDVDIEDDANELLVNIVNMWLTIRGFSMAGSLLEEYKRIAKTNTSKTKSLRKDLQKTHNSMPDQ